MTRNLAALLAASIVLAAAPALAGHDDHHRYCDVRSRSEWKSAKEILDQAAQDGYEVLELDSKHGCWEIEAIDKNRHRVEVIYDPSGKLLWIDD